jgi:phosphinothricin acetyltransferase
VLYRYGKIIAMNTLAELRVATPADAAAIATIYAPVIRETVISFETAEVPADAMRQRIETTLVRYPWLVAEAAGTVVGYAYATQHRARAAYDWSVDVSVYLAERARHRGLGRALYVALLDLLTAQGYANAFAGITLPNDASVGLHEAIGFTPVGVYRSVGWKLGAWRDVGWWQRVLSSVATPPPPVPLPQLDERVVSSALAAGVATLNR